MYTEQEMQKKYRRAWRFVRKHRGFDILLTHAPAYGMGDMDNLSHRGFQLFEKLIRKYHPRYHVHGHVHRSYDSHFIRVRGYDGGTTAINAFGKYYLEI